MDGADTLSTLHTLYSMTFTAIGEFYEQASSWQAVHVALEVSIIHGILLSLQASIYSVHVPLVICCRLVRSGSRFSWVFDP